MTKTEKLIVKKLINSLNESAENNLKHGWMQEYQNWTSEMKTTIESSTAILGALVSDENSEE